MSSRLSFLLIVGASLYFFPKVIIWLLICGLIDVSANRPLNSYLIKQYFFSNYITWLLSPINLFIDLLTFSRKSVYELNDLSMECQNEIKYVLNNINKDFLVKSLDEKIDGKNMMLFKWYGKNINNSIQIDAFHKPFKFIKTIGISAFNKQTSTSRHFGPLRMTLRVLYNINPVQNDEIYIEVNNKKHFWYENPLFIFDDTYIHQSFNNSDQIRYNIYIDVIRESSYFYNVINSMIFLIQLIVRKTKKMHVAYGLWDFIK
ncbi:Aspartyl/Asparaginyl beta-hydroxylase [Legionella massiliensis]|uniref:Aspartyl/Asparaginyl beta-hydroxylase n=1 Tax=Legionella massiliensis TaxID=1034943 RepID=A0A078L1C7_9GAMM|nr:aspartyl/asparaginyl beta-hydroxylase domain-containing protein [Legionella massiliensis]CDZ79037.1 Aspartyl/Asparaginyl beta-hydroxylase [Legionella massiliensis]CEE14775.1 Aspartyl/Asparaginyl beta-hydroxylase [Legionella massiliensis]